MNEFLYDIDSRLIAGVLLVSMLLAVEAGYRIGLRRTTIANDAAKEHINGIQASILGILALLLGFTLSLSLQRFDTRSEAVVDEANAIGTAYLRAQLLPPTLRADAQKAMRDYVDVRVKAGTLTPPDRIERDRLVSQTASMQAVLWSHARQAIEKDPAMHASALFVSSVNELIDSFGRRDAALDRHVPELVLQLLYVTFIMAGAIVGFASGISGNRPSMVSYMMVALIVVLVFVILDLDRPRRGLITVSQRSLVALQASMRADALAADQRAPAPQGSATGR